jgi:prophage regulatory protein
MQSEHVNQFIRIHEASNLSSLGKSTIRLWVAQGKFPEPISLSATIKVWRKKDIEDWIDSFSSKGTSDGVA